METKHFLNVGAFARVCHTTKETLLHYDRKGLLKPRYVAGNGYRRYSVKQYFDFDLISLLKETGSTLEEIKRYRQAGERDGYLTLFREKIAVLEKERERITHRLSMLTTLAAMGEEVLSAEYDSLFFERREARNILVYPVDSEKITDRESSVECYSECLMRSVTDGNAVDPPLGMIIPEECASAGTFRICWMFTAAWKDVSPDHVQTMKEGLYACLFHRGSIDSHARAFERMMKELSRRRLRLRGPVYAYDQMNYALGEMGEAYVAKYAAPIE